MNDLILSLQIFQKYFKPDSYAPSNCIHDVFMLCDADDYDIVSSLDQARLEELGWHFSSEYDCWCSFRFGSC